MTDDDCFVLKGDGKSAVQFENYNTLLDFGAPSPREGYRGQQLPTSKRCQSQVFS